MNIALFLEMAADAAADRTALVCGDTRWSYGEIDAGGQALAESDAGEGITIQLFTSGTRAAPKAAILRHSNLTSDILGTVEFGSAPEEAAAIVSVPPYHIAGIAALLSSIYAQRRILMLPAFAILPVPFRGHPVR